MEPQVLRAASADLAHEPHSPISWGAVLAGSATALALLLLLTTLAAGFGMKLAPWLASRDSLGAFTPILGACMVAAQVVSIGLGGYLAGRLRVHWLNVHGHEVHFRDTAHGLLVWAISTIAGFLLAAQLAAGGGSSPSATAAAAQAVADPAVAQRIADVTAQAAFFTGFGMLLSAFIAAVAAALGGIRRDEMYGKL